MRMRKFIEFCGSKTTENEGISGKFPSFYFFHCRKIITLIEKQGIRFWQWLRLEGVQCQQLLEVLMGKYRLT